MFLPSFRSDPHTSLAHTRGGFGLIELMVSISIMVIVSSVILARQSSFNGAVLLRSQAYEIALDLREVQLTAVNTQDVGGGFRSKYGVHFNTANATTKQRYDIFRDADDDGYYDNGENFGGQGILDPRFEIESIAASDGAPTPSQLSVVFERPNFDAKFFDSSGEITGESGFLITVRRIGTTGTADGDIRIVEVTSTGQIAVQ